MFWPIYTYADYVLDIARLPMGDNEIQKLLPIETLGSSYIPVLYGSGITIPERCIKPFSL